MANRMQTLKRTLANWRAALGPALSEAEAMQISVALACVFVTALLGYANVTRVILDIRNGYCWPLAVWAATIAVIIIVLMPRGFPLRLSKLDLIALPLLALGAALPRFLRLDAVGFHTDEMGLADFALRHVFPTPDRTINPFITGASAHPTLYHYLARLSLLVFGQTIAGLRASSAVGGVLAVLATYALVATFQGRRTALIAAVVMAGSHYHIHWSRIGLNNIWDTLWMPLTLACFAWGWKRRWSGGAVLAGAALGLSQYFYPGSRVALFLVPWLVYVLWRQDGDGRRMAIHVGKMLAVAACIAVPLALYAVSYPQIFFSRANEVYGWNRASMVAALGPQFTVWRYLWYQIWRSFGAYIAVPDSTGFYAPGVPFLQGLAAPLFVAGFVEAVRMRQGLPVVWILLVTFLGGIMLNGAPSSSHLIGSIPAFCWLVAIPIDWLFASKRWIWGGAALAIVLGVDLYFYFGVFLPRGSHDLVQPFPPGPFH
jgi:4-amino-4-deoxy-L-arabinose transferase-like glycosyltransferase